MTNSEMQAEALARAEQGDSLVNYPAIYSGLMAKGIPESDIEPRVNVLTFNAWIAKGRVVKRGEHGVKVTTWVPIRDRDSDEVTGKRPKTAVVFHISQTKELGEGGYRSRPSNYRNASKRRDYGSATSDSVRDPGEDAADRWNESHGDRWQES